MEIDKKTEVQPDRREWLAGKRHLTSLQISDSTRQILCEQSRRLGVSRSDIIEMAVRKLASDYGIT